MPNRPLRICVYGNALILAGLALYFFLIPALTVVHDLTDKNIRGPGVPRVAVRLFMKLTPRYERWARQRLASRRAEDLSVRDISGTEWPIFGSVFYLWSVQSLQRAWEHDHDLVSVEPRQYARTAIEVATELVIDPRQAFWVKQHWGKDYLHRQNVFYRMMVIAALTCHAELTKKDQHLAMLRDQVETLSSEIDASPRGLLEDYPGECYPSDVLTAIACIRRADAILGTDHTAFVARAIRGFQGACLDKRKMVPYAAMYRKGEALGPSRGCGNSYVSLFAPEIWPRPSAKWYSLYEKHFWQEQFTAIGFREFPKAMQSGNWYMDVDAGPVLAGFGFAACAFGVGAARVNNRFDHAYPLTAEMLVCSWPLPDGTLAGPRILSNATDAPYLGETAILFNLTRTPVPGTKTKIGGKIPWFVFIMLALLFGSGLVLVVAVILNIRRWRRQRHEQLQVRLPRAQVYTWLAILVGAVVCSFIGQVIIALILLLVMQFYPRVRVVPVTDR